MTCSQTGGIEGGSGGVIKVEMLEGGLVGGVEASGGGGGGGWGQKVCQGTQSHWGVWTRWWVGASGGGQARE